MQRMDWFMGGLAIALGVVLLVSAALGARWLMELGRPKWLAEKLGTAGARGVLMAIGALTIALGIVVFSGWRPPWAR